ncbi:MAG TPA: glycosyltransferase family 4 protein, partial [Gemmatimonadales bacterium]
MRVLFWTDWFLPSIGGVEVFSARLLPALARRGHEITVVAGHHRAGLPDVTVVEGVTVRRYWFHQLLAANDLHGIAETVARIGRLKQELLPEVIHLNTLGPSVLFHLQSVARWPAPVLLTLHSPLMREAVGPDTLYGRTLRSARWLNCNSHALRDDVCRHVPEMELRSSVTYYGMEPPALEPGPRPREDPVVLGFGRLVEDKGFDLAVRAFGTVRARFPRARLVLAGEGEARGGLERLAASCGVADAVDFVGPQSPEQIPGLINRASVVVVPSRWDEPFGLVALESALMARPVVAARAGGLVEVVENGVTGLLVEKEDAGALAAAVTELLADPVAADRMGAIARLRAVERFG